MFSIIILMTSLSFDAFGVGIAYSLRKIKIPFISGLIIFVFSVVYTELSILAGSLLMSYLPYHISKIVGILILVFMGFYIILQEMRHRTQTHDKNSRLNVLKNPEEGDIDNSGSIDMIESTLLSLALSIDAIGVILGSTLSDLRSPVIPFAVGISQVTFLYAGTIIGKYFSKFGNKYPRILTILPGILLISLGLIRMWNS